MSEISELERIERKLDRLAAVHEIQNLMGRLMYLFEAGKYEETLELFAGHTEGVTAEAANHGRREGLEGAREMMVDFWQRQYAGHGEIMRKLYPQDENPEGRNGIMDLRCLGTPVIEVAGDMQTAKGMWYAPTTATECRPGAEKPAASLLWLKFAMDFVREDGRWRIWHYHAMPMSSTAYEKSWVDSSMEMEKRMEAMPPEMKARMAPKGPVTAYHAYSVHKAPAYDPPPPEPYDSFEDTFSY